MGKPSLVASSSGSAKYARYARLLPSTRKSSLSRTGPSSSWSSAPVECLGHQSNGIVLRDGGPDQGVPGGDIDDAAALLAARHRRHCAASRSCRRAGLPGRSRARWQKDGRRGRVRLSRRLVRRVLVGAPDSVRAAGTWMLVGIAGHAVRASRSSRATSTRRRPRVGRRRALRHCVLVPATDPSSSTPGSGSPSARRACSRSARRRRSRRSTACRSRGHAGRHRGRCAARAAR